MQLHQTITLADGRTLAYADIGNPDHHPVLYFHGFPGSRLEAAFAEQTILDCQVRVIAVERPGYGRSSHDATRKITDWPSDVAQLADSLGLEKFSLLGMSAGGVYALACAHGLPDRIYRTGIAGTLAPMDQREVLKDMNWLSRNAFRLMSRDSVLARRLVGQLLGFCFKHYPRQLISGMKPSLCHNDRLAFADRLFQQAFCKSLEEAYRQGYRGPYSDLTLVTKPWGFEPEDIPGPVHLWHGQRDTVVPHSMGQHIQSRLPNCQGRFPQDDGHFSIITNFMRQALLTLKAEQTRTREHEPREEGTSQQATEVDLGQIA